MLFNNGKIAFRNIWKDKFYSGLNLLGLAVAVATFLLLMNYVRFERSYEDFHKNAANIYRITLDMYKGTEYIGTDCETYPPAAPIMKQTMPEVAEYVRLQDLGTYELVTGERSVLVDKAYAADKTLFSVFSYELIDGNRKQVLAGSNNVVITETVAKKLFGAVHVTGSVIKIKNSPYIISGVVKDIPANTHLKFGLLFPFDYINSIGFNMNNWNGNNNFTYLLMKPGTRLDAFNRKLQQFSKERLQEEQFKAEPIKDIHLHSHKLFEPEANGNYLVVNFLFLIAFLVLFIGVANYINITTARLVERTREVSVRKVLGSSKWAVTKLFFTESFLITVMAFIAALLLVCLLRPLYSSIVGVEIGDSLLVSEKWEFWQQVILLFMATCLLSGLYPAILASAVQVNMATKRVSTSLAGGSRLRKVLMVAQFTAALAVLMSAVVIYRQIRFVRHQDLGMNMDQVLVVKGPMLYVDDSLQRMAGTHFKEHLLKDAGIQGVAFATSLPGGDYSTMNTQTGVRRVGATLKEGYNYYLYGIDKDFIPLLNISLVAGRNFFSGTHRNDEVLINEEAGRLLGFSNPAAAIGKKLKVDSGPIHEATVIGVTKNYRQQSLKQAQNPLILWEEQGVDGYFAIKMQAKNARTVIDAIKMQWNENFPGHVMDYFFMDERFNNQYKQDVQFGKIVNVFSGITFFIACLGLLGLSALNTSLRTKEIGIRKVMGAGFKSILSLLSADFLKLVAVAIVLAIPIVIVAMNAWLQNFVYHIRISWWLYPGVGLLAMMIALLTILLQAYKTIRNNPVKALRSE